MMLDLEPIGGAAAREKKKLELERMERKIRNLW
jgi:hypothetical protein